MSVFKILLLGLVLPLPFTSAAATQANTCLYPDRHSGELQQGQSCGTLRNGLLQLDNNIRSRIHWSKFGMQCIFVNSHDQRGWFYVNQNGLGRRSPFYQDNDCNAFSAGLAVGLEDNKVVFFNQLMAIEKRTDYSWASHFYQGFAKVCRGQLEKEYDQHGEHYQLQGGQCGFIDRNFREVIAVQYSFSSTPEPDVDSRTQ